MAGLEPARDVIPADFKSAVFTISPQRRGVGKQSLADFCDTTTANFIG